MTFEAIVHRKIPDLVRFAAEDVLRRERSDLAAIDRAELWTFEVEGDGGDDVGRVLEETTLVVNPNIHRYHLREHGDGTGAVRAADGAASRIIVRVTDRVDAKGRAVTRAIRERRGLTDVRKVTRSVQWTVDLAAPVAEAESAARAMVGEVERGAGLLANPHSQEIEWSVEAL